MALRQRQIQTLRDRDEIITLQIARKDLELVWRLCQDGRGQLIQDFNDTWHESEDNPDRSEQDAAERIINTFADLLNPEDPT